MRLPPVARRAAGRRQRRLRLAAQGQVEMVEGRGTGRRRAGVHSDGVLGEVQRPLAGSDHRDVVRIGSQESRLALGQAALAQDGDAFVGGLVGVADRAHAHEAAAHGRLDARQRRACDRGRRWPAGRSAPGPRRRRRPPNSKPPSAGSAPRRALADSRRRTRGPVRSAARATRGRRRRAGKPGVLWLSGIQLARDRPAPSTSTRRRNRAR